MNQQAQSRYECVPCEIYAQKKETATLLCKFMNGNTYDATSFSGKQLATIRSLDLLYFPLCLNELTRKRK